MTKDFNDEWEHIPEAGENKKDPKPVKFHHRYLSTAERNQCMVWYDGEYVPDFEKFFRYSVKSIDDLIINSETIDDANKFLEARHPILKDFFDEETAEVLNRNKKDIPKNS